MVAHAEIRVVHRGGSKINFREPVITNDSRFLLCASGESVKVYSSSSEECVHDLQGHTDLVSGIVRNPSNHLQVYSCSVDGTVRLWDFTDGILIKTFIIGYPIYSIYVSENHGGVVFVVVPMANDKSSELFQLVAVHLPRSGDQEVEARELSAVLCDVSPSGAASFGRGGEYIAAAKGLQLEVFFFKKQKSYRFFLKSGNKKGAKNAFTCVSCHPKEDCIATGHEDGKIRLWRNFNQKKEYTYSTLHWHHGAVNTLQFTPEGTNLLSGGIESVLVQWRYTQENQKDFLPRLGGAITHIAVSPDGSLFCTSHSDNKITIIQSCVKVSAIIQGLVKGEGVRTDLMIDPRSKALVLNGKPGHLQFYSLHRDKLLYNLDIVQQEYIHEEGLDQFEVVKAAFDTRGDWLATVEERTQKGSELEINLKLWAYNEQTQSFVLNTTVTAPHEDQITAMCFSPSPETTMLVTISFDGHFKAWLLADHSDTKAEGASWSCDFVGGYHLLKPGCCCFSADGSLLAVGFQEVVTVWSPSWELLTTLSQPPGAIRDLCFGRLSCSKYLLGTSTKNQLCCWNLLTCSLEWSTPVDVSLLQADPLSENMAAFCSQSGCSDLFVFKPGESRPLYSQRALCTGKVQHAVFAPRDQMLESCEEHAQWLNRSQLYFLTQHMDLMTFSTKTEEDRLLASSKRLMVDDSVAVTPFYLLLGKHRQQQQEALTNPMAERIQLPQGSIAIKELLYTPAHVLPSASFLCSMFVRSLLISSSAAREEKEPVEEEMESEEEDSEGEAELRDARQDLGGSATWGPGEELGAPALTKAQERELRRVKHFDHSWLSSLLEC
ncbi:WD repeat-containing protein 75 isoform X1 [Salmo salar]|uniref:WD repeat-containing protein 75 isoform X1 n=1 Tax=Salmo salar TaxID=8030 RepID=A0A1S3NWT1_SALSA|nr:WD repeat-containing protein 75 isoform X1 [Salmo salar]|eukprot:XP_014019725.1 PREDICTED: WD repeat-containing protein 75 isoform X1 [Salmo salar]